MRHDTPASGLLRSRSKSYAFTNFSFFVCIFFHCLCLDRLPKKLRFNFSFISLHISCLGFNSWIFRLTSKLLKPFVSIVLAVTNSFSFLKFAFCCWCSVPSRESCTHGSVVHWTKAQRATTDESSAHCSQQSDLPRLRPSVSPIP